MRGKLGTLKLIIVLSTHIHTLNENGISTIHLMEIKITYVKWGFATSDLCGCSQQ